MIDGTAEEFFSMTISLPKRTACLLLLVVAITAATATSHAQSLASATAAVASAGPNASPGDRPWWRSAQLNGVASSPSAPTEWGPDSNIAWKVDVPGRGHATPCVVGDQIFISTAVEGAEEMRLLSFDRATGAEGWNTLLHSGGFMHIHSKNSHASATPACAGGRVFALHMVDGDASIDGGGEGVYLSAVGLDGEILWQKKAGPFTTKHGYAPSPILYGSTVIVSGDSENAGAFVAAFDQATGEEVWRTGRRDNASFGCGVVATIAGREQLVIPGCDETVSYDPTSGEMLWRVDGPSLSAANTVAFDSQKVYSSGGWPQKNLLAIRADGSGDVTDSHIAWRKTKAVCYVPTMLVQGQRLYTVSDDGVATCYDTESGDTVWVKRLGGGFSASPIMVGDSIYLTDESGKTHVIKAADEFKPVAVNDLADGGFATPVVLDGKIFLRTSHQLYCIAE
ncbi:outer membrane biogenesis protein BamB [Pseudobythopirellula maris]|uniref:Outer membrane biogenesis protein BamB n=1 Tax=Pseudobythopirellula maris TaxID=2527991 RepID=A0A5C5ZNC1_9BACT|nr:PQQ-binding-like beta-propeller repeat protein [Pseudobythopirellula maris]TWT88341.1 outer membrane biogenesis protein BamB [Pseudobythopirellula maris]